MRQGEHGAGVLISGSIRYLLESVAADQGFDHLLCTDLETWPGGDLSEYQLITYSGPTTEYLNKPAFCESAKGIGKGRAGKTCVFDNNTSLHLKRDHFPMESMYVKDLKILLDSHMT